MDGKRLKISWSLAGPYWPKCVQNVWANATKEQFPDHVCRVHSPLFTSNNGTFKSGKPTICERHALSESNPATVTRRAIVGPVIHGYHSMTPSLHEIKCVCAETFLHPPAAMIRCCLSTAVGVGWKSKRPLPTSAGQIIGQGLRGAMHVVHAGKLLLSSFSNDEWQTKGFMRQTFTNSRAWMTFKHFSVVLA